MDLDKSFGSWIVETQTQIKYLDMFSMYASQAIGYNHPYMIENLSKLAKASLIKPALPDVFNDIYEQYVEKFVQKTDPQNNFRYVFFIEGGALAVENALKVAFDWKARKNLQKGIFKRNMKVIYFCDAFHGRSGYTLSITNMNDPKKTKYFPKHKWCRIKNPKLRFPITEDILEEVIHSEEFAIRQIKDAITKYPGEIASIIIEPIQGEGGDNHFRAEFFKELRKISDEEDILLIFDEIQTGMGLTGKMWAYEHFGIKPDIISFGKKTQVSGIFVNDRVDEVTNNVFKQSSRISSTFGGNLTDLVRCGLILDVYEKERLLENTNVQGQYFFSKLNMLQQKYPEFISNVRGKGLFIAFDLPSEAIRNTLVNEAKRQNLIIGSSGYYSLRLRPHLNVTTEDIDRAINSLDIAVSKIQNQFARIKICFLPFKEHTQKKPPIVLSDHGIIN